MSKSNKGEHAPSVFEWMQKNAPSAFAAVLEHRAGIVTGGK